MAAGKGTRLGGVLPKPLSVVIDKESILSRIIKVLLKLNVIKIIIVVGYKSDEVINHVNQNFQNTNNISFVIQNELNGTLNAVETGLTAVPEDSEQIIVLPADNGWFLKSKTLHTFTKEHLEKHAVVSILLTKEFNDSLHKVEYKVSDNKVVDLKLRGDEQNDNQIYLAGTGILCIKKRYFLANKHLIKPLPNNEYTVSRIVEVALSQNKIVGYSVVDINEVMTINTKEDLQKLRSLAGNEAILE